MPNIRFLSRPALALRCRQFPDREGGCMSLLRKPSFLVLMTLWALLGVSPVSAQITNVTDITSTPVAGVGHDYIKLLTETVNPANGSLSVRIGVPVPPGRKLTIPFAFEYDSNGAVAILPDNRKGTPDPLAQGGWSYSVPRISIYHDLYTLGPQCKFLDDYVFYDATGGRNPLFLSYTLDPTLNQCGQAGPLQVTYDRENFYTSVVSPAVNPGDGGPVYVADNDGTVYFFPPQPNADSGTQYFTYELPSQIEDRNGNTSVITSSLTVNTSTFSSSNGTLTVTDTVGRPAIIVTGFGNSSGDTVQVSGLVDPVSGLPSPYKLSWQMVPSGWPLIDQVVPSPNSNCSYLQSLPTGQSNVVQAISLPNGQQYQFHYDAYGLLDKITYPTGGYVSYEWSTNHLGEAAHFTRQSVIGTTCDFIYDPYAVAHRDVSFDGANIALHQDFMYQTNAWVGTQWGTKTTTVVTYDCARNNFNCTGAPSTTTVYTYSPVFVAMQPNDQSADTVEIPVEQSVVYQDQNGSILETTTKGWYTEYAGSVPPMIACELHTLDDGQISGTFFSYSNGSLADKKEFDYGQIGSTSICADNAAAPSGVTPARETQLTYPTFPSGPIFPAGTSIVDRPSSIYVFSNGVIVNATDYFYDQTPVTGVGALVPGTHDETYYGAGSTAFRGNVTTITKQCWQGSGASAATCGNAAGTYNATTTFQYDETGQVTSMTDPCANSSSACPTLAGGTTTYSYSDNYDVAPSNGITNAYLTGVSNPLSQSIAFQYAYGDGQLIRSTDANNQPTGYAYNDSLRRLKTISYPDGGSTSALYDDTPNAVTVTASRAMSLSPAQSSTTLVTLDGMGRTVKRVEQNDPDCPSGDTTDTSYDGFGRTYSVSNAYCPVGDPTYGKTTYTYDALGRTTAVVAPDGSLTQTAYYGNTVTLRDPALKWRTSQLDAFGRVTSVSENTVDPVTLATIYYQTLYTYDGLDNLTSVAQWANNTILPGPLPSYTRPRTFTYDSLARLTSATNPESGQISYTYDPNGNLYQKTAPQPNQANAAVLLTTTYTYDGLNRLAFKVASDSTPIAGYSYDGGPPPGNSSLNLIGRFWSSTTWDKSSGAVMTQSGVGSYDSMGRPAATIEYVANSPWTSGLQTSYTYDLLGNITSFRDGLGLTFTAQFNPVSRLTQIRSNITDSTHPLTLFRNGRYNASGGLVYVDRDSVGGVGLADTAAFNTQLQPCRTNVNASGSQLQMCTDALPSGNLLDLSYGYGNSIANPSNPDAANNGNLTSMAAMGAQAFNRGYSYDPLNRLSEISTSGSDCAFTWTIDPWGNRTDQTSTTTNPFCHSVSVAVDTNNRLTQNLSTGAGFTYDAAGNLAFDGAHFYYYDGENQLVQVDGTVGDCSTATACYQYDAEGKRIQKIQGAARTIYAHDIAGRVVDELDAVTAGALANYIYANGALFAEYKGCETYFVHHDHLGSIRLLTDSDGFIVDSLDYLPFGEQIAGDTITTRKFTGKERDVESGLDYFGARHFESGFGRFLTADPLGNTVADAGDPQSWNLYSYVGNSPLSFTDPSGFCRTDDEGNFHDDENGQCLTGQTPAGETTVQAPPTEITVQDTAPTVDYAYSDIPSALHLIPPLSFTTFGGRDPVLQGVIARLRRIHVYSGPVFAAPRSRFANITIETPRPRPARHNPPLSTCLLAPSDFVQWGFGEEGREDVHEELGSQIPWLPPIKKRFMRIEETWGEEAAPGLAFGVQTVSNLNADCVLRYR